LKEKTDMQNTHKKSKNSTRVRKLSPVMSAVGNIYETGKFRG